MTSVTPTYSCVRHSAVHRGLGRTAALVSGLGTTFCETNDD